MKKLLLTLWLTLLIPLIAGAETVTKTYQFSAGTKDGISDDQGGSWTNGDPGLSFSSNEFTGAYGGSGATLRGISSTQTGSFTSDAEFQNVKSISIDCSTNQASSNSIEVKVGDVTIGSTGTLAKANHQIETFTATTPLSGKITISITRSSKGTVWVAGLVVTTEEAPAHEPYTVKLNAGSGTCASASLNETTAGMGVVLPTAIGVEGWEFAGWATESVIPTATRPTLLAAGETYVPAEDNTTLYAVYSHAEVSATPAEEKEVATYTFSDGLEEWTLGGSISNKNSYYLLANQTGYFEYNLPIDFTTITKVIVKARTYGSISGTKSFSIEDADGNTWGTNTVSNSTLSEYTVLKSDNATANGVAKLRVKTDCGAAATGIGVSEIHVYAKDAFVTTYDSNPTAGGEVEKREFVFDGFKDYTLVEGESIKLEYPSNSPEIIIVSSDDNIVLADDNEFVANAAGEATITAAWGESEYWLEGETDFTVKVLGKASLIVDPETLALSLGDAPAAVTYAYDGDGTLSVVSSDSTVATAVIDTDAETVTVTAVAGGEATITLSAPVTDNYSAVEVVIPVKVTDPNAPVYKLVTDVNTLQDGDKIIIACPEKDMIMSNELESEYRHKIEKAEAFNVDKTDIEYAPGMMILELGRKDNGTYTLKTTNYAGTDGYLGNNGTKNYCYVYTTNQVGSNATITISDGIATITFDNNSTDGGKVLCYNADSNGQRFSLYKTSSNYPRVSIYRFGVPVEKELIAFEFDGFKDYTFDVAEEAFELTLPEDAPVVEYTSSDEEAVAYIGDNTFMFGDAGTATITATWSENDKYLAGNATFTVTVTDGEAPVGETTTSTYNFNYLEESMMDEAQSDLGEYWSTLYTKSYRGNGHVQVMISTANKLEYVAGEGWKFIADADDEVNAYIYVLLNDKLDGSQYDVTKVNFGIDANPEFYEISDDDNVTVSNNVWTGKTPAPVFNLYSLGDIVIGDIDVTFEHDVIAAPVFSMRALTVTLSHEAGHTIMYKVTGSRAQAPARVADANDFTEYTEPFKVNKGDVVEYYAVHPHGMTSTTVTRDIVTTGIDGIDADDDSEAVYYNLQGVRVASENLVPGIYVRSQGGTTTKVLVK